MTLNKMAESLKRSSLRRNEKTWYFRWVEQFAKATRQSPDAELRIDRQELIQFLQMHRDRGLAAWKRLQIAEAVVFYRTRVRESDDPKLSDITSTLRDLMWREREAQAKGLVQGMVIDPREPEVIQQLRREIRLSHYSRRTELAYVGWVQRFREYLPSASRDLAGIGENEIKEFLSELAVKGQVAASTQNQAFSALLFLFRRVLKRELHFIDAVRAKRPKRLPVVLSRKQVRSLLSQLGGRNLLSLAAC